MSSDSHNASVEPGDLREQQHGDPRPAKTGAGSGSAMTAMLKKRRQDENHPDDAVPENGNEAGCAK